MDLARIKADAEEALALAEKAIDGPWHVGPTPGYLAMGQHHHGNAPLTIRSPAHTEEIATAWTYLLPTEANAAFIARSRTLLPELARAALAMQGVVEAARAVMERGPDDDPECCGRFRADEHGEPECCNNAMVNVDRLDAALAALEPPDADT